MKNSPPISAQNYLTDSLGNSSWMDPRCIRHLISH